MEFDRANEMILYHHEKLLSDYLDIEQYPYIHLSVKLDRIFLPLGSLLLFYISLNRVRMTFARLSNLCNSVAFALEPLNP